MGWLQITVTDMEVRMTNRSVVEEVLGRVRRFEEDLSSIGVSVDVRGLDVAGRQYGSHETATCVLCAAYEKGFADGRSRGARESTDRFEGAMNRLLDRS